MNAKISASKLNAADSGAADTNNWDTVSAIRFQQVNQAIKIQKSSPPSFTGQFNDPISGGEITVSGDFSDWQLSGGSGNLVHMDLPFTGGQVTAGTTVHKVGAGTATIEVNLYYIPQPGDTNAQDLKVDASKAVTSVSVTMADSQHYQGFAAYFQEVLQSWLSTNLQDFNHVFAVANLGSEESSPAFKWLKPTKIGYAVEAPVGVAVDDYVFGVLAMTEGREGTNLTYQISPNAIPAGMNGGFLITFERFMNEIFVPGVVPIFNGAATSDFVISADGTQITNNKALTFADFEIPTNKSGTETRTITDATIATGGFTLTAFDTYLELQFNDLTFTFEEGYIAHLTYTGYQTIGSTTDNHLKFYQPTGMPPKLNVTIVETTAEKWKELIDSIVIGVAFAVVGAMIGGALGPAAEEAGEAGETAATDAAENAADDASSMDFDVTGPEDDSVDNLDEVESDSESEAADDMEEPSRTQKFKGWFRRNWSKMLGMAIGGAVGAVVTKIPDILRALAEGDLTKVPTLDEFAEEAVAPVVFANTKAFTLQSIAMNGVIQMGLQIELQSASEVLSDRFYEDALDKSHEQKRGEELICAPVSALAGVSEADAKALATVGIKTIKDLAEHRFVGVAQKLSKIQTKSS